MYKHCKLATQRHQFPAQKFVYDVIDKKRTKKKTHQQILFYYFEILILEFSLNFTLKFSAFHEDAKFDKRKGNNIKMSIE